MAMFRGQINLIELIKLISLIIQSLLIGWNYHSLPHLHVFSRKSLHFSWQAWNLPSSVSAKVGLCECFKKWLKRCFLMAKEGEGLVESSAISSSKWSGKQTNKEINNKRSQKQTKSGTFHQKVHLSFVESGRHYWKVSLLLSNLD